MFNATNGHQRSKGLLALSLTLAALSPFALTGCGGGSGDSGGGGNNNPAPTPNSVSKSIDSSGGSIPLNPVSGVAYTLKFPATAVAAATTVTITPVDSAKLAVPITRGARGRSFTADSGNTYITAFTIDAGTVTKFNVPVTIGASGLTSLPAGTVLNLAQLTNSQWNNVGTLTVDASGNLSSQLASFALPGIVAPGTYVIYKPGTGVAPAHF